MGCDVIIPTLLKNKAYLDTTIASLSTHTQAFHPIYYLARNGEGTDYPQGQCQAVNRQAAKGKSKWLFITNDDMYFAPNWDWGFPADLPLCWSPNLIEPTGMASAAPFLKCDAGSDLATFNSATLANFITLYYVNKAIPQGQPDWEPGFNLPFFIRRDVWETIGGYDTFYDPWGSNSDTCLQTRINIAGITPQRNRNCLVYHFGSKSETFTPDKQEFWQQNFDYYTEKYGFNRDTVPGCDVWNNTNILPVDKSLIKFKAEWEGRYQ